MKKLKIAHLTSVHPAFDTRIFHKECRTLVEAGHDVSIVVPHEKDEVVQGVHICAVPRPKSRPERMTKTVWQVFRMALDLNADVYHFHDPELVPIGILLKIRGKRVIYDVHENVPGSMLTKEYLPPLGRKVAAKAMSFTHAVGTGAFDAIVTATPSIAAHFSGKKTLAVQNFPILGELMAPHSVAYRERPENFAYVGVITGLRGIRESIQAMSLLKRHPKSRLFVAGNFSPSVLEDEVKLLSGYSNVDYLGYQSRPQVASLLGQVRAGLVLFHPAPNHMESQPNKLFEYMSAGIPVIASDFPLWREIIEGAGLLIDPQDPKAIANALTWILENPVEAEKMGQRGMDAVKDIFNWEIEAIKLRELYNSFARN